MQQTLILIRGIPGSGKSTLAKSLAEAWNFSYFEADMFFETEEGYKFDPKKIQLAHAWCYQEVKSKLQGGHSCIVSNTFIRKWEMDPYLRIADNLRIQTHILICNQYFGSIHGVPEQKIQQMRENFQL